MDISLIHAGLAAGAALAVVPLILHLIMRQTPKRVIFPALRLLQLRHKRSTKRLRIKNWLLLLARMALVALMALALARPALNARVPLGDREVPTALALVVDTSLSMGYVDRGETRLDAAKEVAGEILGRLPESSQVYLVDSAEPVVPGAISPSAARKRLKGLELRAAQRPLNDGIERAYDALAESRRDLPRLEAYVLTDLASSAWDLGRDPPDPDRVREESGREVATYVIRVAPETVRDAAIVAVEARPSAEAEADGRRPFEVTARVRNVGPAETRLVEFVLDGAKRGQQQLDLPADAEAGVTFRTPPNLGPGLHQAQLVLTGTDSLAPDDERFVTFEASPAFDVLVVYDRDPDEPKPSIDASFIAEALDPLGIQQPNRVETLSTDQIGNGFPRELANYAAVFLNNVGKLPEPCWGQLAAYVREGGGVVIGLGPNTDPANYAGEAARAVVPGTVGQPVTVPGAGTAFGDLVDPAHFLFADYAAAISADLATRPVRAYRAFEPVEAPNVRTLIRYQDGKPALVESIVNGPEIGRVLVWTTPLSRRPNPGDPDAWNEFPNPFGENGWSFLVLMMRTVPYLAGAAGTRLNYEAGEVVILPLNPTNRAGSYVVRGPAEDLTQRVNPPREASELVVEGPEALGHWTVTPGGDASTKAGPPLGFSVNARADEADFTAIPKETLDGLLGGPDAYALADSPDEIERVQKTARVGHEVYPWLILLILLLLTAENYLANRFHREAGPAAAGPATAAA